MQTYFVYLCTRLCSSFAHARVHIQERGHAHAREQTHTHICVCHIGLNQKLIYQLRCKKKVREMQTAGISQLHFVTRTHSLQENFRLFFRECRTVFIYSYIKQQVLEFPFHSLMKSRRNTETNLYKAR